MRFSNWLRSFRTLTHTGAELRRTPTAHAESGFGRRRRSMAHRIEQAELLETRTLLTATSLNPSGSQIYLDGFQGTINEQEPVSSFSLSLDAGQTLTVLVSLSGEPELRVGQLQVSVFDPSNALLGEATASGINSSAQLQSLPVLTTGS